MSQLYLCTVRDHKDYLPVDIRRYLKSATSWAKLVKFRRLQSAFSICRVLQSVNELHLRVLSSTWKEVSRVERGFWSSTRITETCFALLFCIALNCRMRHVYSLLLYLGNTPFWKYFLLQKYYRVDNLIILQVQIWNYVSVRNLPEVSWMDLTLVLESN